MAKSKTRTVALAPRAASPVIRIQQPAAQRIKRRMKRGYRAAKAGGMTPLSSAITAAVVGLAEKSGIMSSIPSVPVIGRKGAVALGAWYWSKHGGGKLARDVAIVSAVLAGYEFGKEGTISGDDGYAPSAVYSDTYEG